LPDACQGQTPLFIVDLAVPIGVRLNIFWLGKKNTTQLSGFGEHEMNNPWCLANSLQGLKQRKSPLDHPFRFNFDENRKLRYKF